MNDRTTTMLLRTFLRICSTITVPAAATVFAAAPIVIDAPRFHAYIDSTPTWVSSDVSHGAPRPADLRGQSTAYLSIEWQVNLLADTIQQYFKTVAVPLTSEGVSRTADFAIDYAAEYQGLVFHEISVKRGPETSNRLTAESIRLIQREEDLEQRMYSGIVTASALIPDIRVGDTVTCAYSLRGRNPVLGKRFSATFPLGWPQPVGRTAVRVLAPESRPLHWQTSKFNTLPRTEKHESTMEYLWIADTLAPVAFEESVPDWYNPFSSLDISEYADWQQVAIWALELYARTDSSVALVDSLARALRPGAANAEYAARRALSYVQDSIRYFGVELGVNSHLPSSPAHVLARRYGDCKDKSLLLSLLLRRMGYKAWPALVSTRHGPSVTERLPSPSAFDHVIVAVDIEGERLWLDPTAPYQRGALHKRSWPDFGFALLVDQKTRKLERIKPPKEYRNSMEVIEQFATNGFDKPAELTITTVYKGALAELQRAYFEDNTRSDIQREFTGYYARLHPGIVPSADISMSDNEQVNEVTVIEQYTVHSFFEKRKGRLFLTVYSTSIEPFTRVPASSDRRLPMAVEYPIEISHTTTVTFMDDIRLDLDENDGETIDNDILSYRFRNAYSDTTLTVSSYFKLKTALIEPTMVPAYAGILREISGNTSYTVWIPHYDGYEADAISRRLVTRLRALARERR